VFETIIVPLDGSELAESALPMAFELKQKFGSRLLLVRSLESESSRMAQTPALFESPVAVAANADLMEKMVTSRREEATTYLEGVRERLGSDGIEALLVEGRAPDAIVDTAKQENASLIVMSSHGRGGLGRLVFGSVADAVLRQSAVPVLLIRSA
jgi:nucleotide-binding universal stress UspA family protein